MFTVLKVNVTDLDQIKKSFLKHNFQVSPVANIIHYEGLPT